MGSHDQPERIALDGCEVDVGQSELIRGAERQHLTTKELEVLCYLASHPGRAISHEELLEKVWGHPRLASTQPVYSVVKRLRRKIDGHGEHRHLVGVHGVGYRFEPARGAASIARARTPRGASDDLVGRAAERAAVQTALESGARLVSLVGPGGAGKTRLARELASDFTERGHEVAWCDLSSVAASDVRRAVALAVGARSGDGDETGEPLVGAMRSRACWALILDDAEHALDAVAPLALALAPAVRVLVTSRERLAVAGETVVEVGPLSIADGARLFRARALAAGATLAADAAVDDVVARLDGLPLAIELTAAHASVVSFDRARLDLDRQIDHIVATRRGVPARHASLRGSVESSYRLLDDDERAVLSQCTVFAGTFGFEAAEAVMAVRGSVRRHLVRLTERSLVRVVDGPGGGGRLGLYRVVRELAAEHLVDADALAARYRDWAHALVRTSGALDEPSRPSAYAALAPEIENLSAAFRSALGAAPEIVGDLALAIDLVASRAHAKEGQRVLREALPAASGEAALRVRLALGRSLQHTGTEGVRFLEDTWAMARAAGDERHAIDAERLSLAATTAMGEPGVALPRLEALLVRARTVPSAAGLIGRVALDLAEAHLVSGSVDRAGELGTEAASVLEASGDPIEAARAAGVLSHVHRERREHADALAALERARRWLEDAGDEAGLARLELDRGVFLAHLGRSIEAADALAAAVAAHHRLGLVTGEIRARDWMVLALLGMGRDDDALAQARELQQLGLDLGRRVYEAERAFGATWLVTGRIDEADHAFGRALDVLAAHGTATVRAHVLSARALARILAGRTSEAEEDLEQCARIHEARGSDAARRHASAELALAREITAPHDATEALLDAAEPAGGSPWEARHAIGRRAVWKMLRARRAGRPAKEIERIGEAARTAMLDGAPGPTDYFTRCSLLLLDHVARPPPR